MTPTNLLTELERRNVKVSLAGDKLRVEAPAGVLTPDLKEVLIKHKPLIMVLLKMNSTNPPLKIAKPEANQFVEVQNMTAWPGIVVPIYRTRPDCMAAGRCKWLTKDDCLLAPVLKEGQLSGWCRERAKTGNRPAVLPGM